MKRKPNPVAKALRNPMCRQRIIKNKKVYNRKALDKHIKEAI